MKLVTGSSGRAEGNMKIEKIELDHRLTDKLVEQLARQSSCPVKEAREAYELEFQRLDRTARIKNFLPVLAARRARKALAHPEQETYP